MAKFFGSSIAGADKNALLEALYIYLHLKNADLVQNNQGGELTEEDLYDNDVILLLAWFGIGSSGAASLVKYFKQENPRVSLVGFFERLKEVVDLNNQVTIENIFEFTSALRDNILLSSDQDIIIFHESDGQFHWNDELFK